MQTNDTSFAAYLIRRGYEFTGAVDYSQPNWCYEFTISDDELHEELRLFREWQINQIIRIHQALVNAGKGREVHVKTMADWPELRWAVKPQGEGAV